MPVEIREIIIRATVGQDSAESTAAGSANNGTAPEPAQEAIEQVMQILDDKKKR